MTTQSNLTPYTDINTLLALLLSRIQAILGKKLIGLYLFGSLVAGDFDYGSSDIDLIAATSTYLDKEEVERLKAMHEDIALKEKAWDDRIEVGYIPLDELRRYNPHFQQPLISPGEPFHVTEVGASWVINRYIMREKGIAVYGPPPKTLVDPISREERIQAVRGRIQDWKEYVESLEFGVSRKSQAYAILTMCRILYSLTYGEFVSKKAAALWAEENLPPEWSSLIRRAFAWRNEWREEQVDHDVTLQETLRFLHFALNQAENESGMTIF
jgi:predicted nucleotidyltransferase